MKLWHRQEFWVHGIKFTIWRNKTYPHYQVWSRTFKVKNWATGKIIENKQYFRRKLEAGTPNRYTLALNGRWLWAHRDIGNVKAYARKIGLELFRDAVRNIENLGVDGRKPNAENEGSVSGILASEDCQREPV